MVATAVCPNVLKLPKRKETSLEVRKMTLIAISVLRSTVTYISWTDLSLLIAQSALEFFPIHCQNGRLGQDLGFGGFAFALKLPELLNTNLAAVRAKLGQTSCFPNGPQIWCPIGQ